ncbi:hypothetical protein [Chroococcidiopsis sp.]|uniref:hypothetical protein n=1 Tax=Chroococcidiopsis sp. TaxID=3088168 RepID=UPI003F398E4F
MHLTFYSQANFRFMTPSMGRGLKNTSSALGKGFDDIAKRKTKLAQSGHLASSDPVLRRKAQQEFAAIQQSERQTARSNNYRLYPQGRFMHYPTAQFSAGAAIAGGLGLGALLGYTAGGVANARRVSELSTPQETALRQRLGTRFNEDFESAIMNSDKSVLGMKAIDAESPEGKRFKGTFDRFMGNEQDLMNRYEDPSYRPMGALIGAGVGAGVLGGAVVGAKYLRGRK